MARSHLEQLLSPLLTYQRVRFTHKRLTTCLSVGAGLAAGALFVTVPAVSVAGERGLVPVTLPLLSLLVGFYVAALGITATLPDRFLDCIPENPPTLRKGRSVEGLTWRRFLSSLFGFMVAIALVAHMVGVAIWVAAPALGGLSVVIAGTQAWIDADTVRQIMRTSGGALYTFLLALLGTNTMFGIFMLSERYLEERERAQLVPASSETNVSKDAS